MNRMYERTGSLFESPFKRIAVSNEAYFSRLVSYIHHNPQKHGLVSDFRDYQYSSYHSHLSLSNSRLNRNEVISWFGSIEEYQLFHTIEDTEPLNQEWFLE